MNELNLFSECRPYDIKYEVSAVLLQKPISALPLWDTLEN